MKYYQEHEQAYQQLLKEGYVGWGKKKTVDDLLFFSFRGLLDTVFDHLPTRPKKILDLGCGTGPVSLHLANRAGESFGIDISLSAIEKARELADELKSPAKFIHGDFLVEPSLGKDFSVIIDSSFLHCIVHDQDRSLCLRRIHDLLEPGGLFIVHTMISDRAVDFGQRFEFDEAGILWYLSERSQAQEAKPHPSGGQATPQRRILPLSNLRKELLAHGFVEEGFQILPGEGPATPDVLFGRYRRP